MLRGNHDGRFVCREPELVVERASPWTGNRTAGEVLRIPIKHGDGAWYVARRGGRAAGRRGQVLLRYRENPNGATGDVAGVATRPATCSA